MTSKLCHPPLVLLDSVPWATMALNLARAGNPLVVWKSLLVKPSRSRTQARCFARSQICLARTETSFSRCWSPARLSMRYLQRKNEVLPTRTGKAVVIWETTHRTASPGGLNRSQLRVRFLISKPPVSALLARLPRKLAMLVAMLAGDAMFAELIRPLRNPMGREAT